MAKSKARAERRARERGAEQPRIETEAERITRLRLARMARDLGMLPPPGTPGLAAVQRDPRAPIRRVDVPPEVLNADAPKLDLIPVARPERVPAPIQRDEAKLAAERDAWIARHGKPEPIKAKDGIPADVAAMLAMIQRGTTLAPSQLQRLAAVMAARQG